MKYYGFNFLWMFSTHGRDADNLPPIVIDEKALDTICAMGCNFVRLPLDYRFWIHDFEYYKQDEKILRELDKCVEAVISRGLHLSLNIHRCPGYCINGAETEKHNLWLDAEAQDAFTFQWKTLAQRYSNYTESQLDFDLLNEPPNIDQYGMTRENHSAIMRRVVDVIRQVSPDRPITLDGLGGGNLAMPELSDLDVRMSTRGYQPMALTHYKASWCPATQGLPYPKYPNCEYDGKIWTKSTLFEHYAPWKELSDKGIPVHVGEMGCYNQVENSIALRWFEDILSVLNENDWGFSFWEFEGDFGIAGHNRVGTRWEKINGFNMDRDLYELFKEHMI